MRRPQALILLQHGVEEAPPVLLDGLRGIRVQVASRQEVEEFVARTLHGQSSGESALDRIQAKIDTNTRPPMVDASSFVVSSQSPGTKPPSLALATPVLDPLLQCYVDTERRCALRHSPFALPPQLSLGQLIVDDLASDRRSRWSASASAVPRLRVTAANRGVSLHPGRGPARHEGAQKFRSAVGHSCNRYHHK